MITDFHIVLPAVLHTLHVFAEYHTIIDTYLLKIFKFFSIVNPMRMFRSVILMQIMGVEYQNHYRQFYPEIKSYFSSYCMLYGVDKIMEAVGKLTNSMASWKLIMIQSGLVKIRCPQLLSCPGAAGRRVADIDVTTLQSSSSVKEGAVPGFNKKAKGRPCFQLSAAFIGRIFVDAKLFPGGANPKDFFQKAVKRLISLGQRIDIVRADSAYMTHENLLFLEKLSLGYAIGAPATFKAVQIGKTIFKKLARLKSSAIIPAGKGVALYDMKKVTLTSGVKTRIVIVRRINRTQKKGKWHVTTYFYGISSNMELSAVKLYRFYHKRQCIEAGFRELKNHYHLERLPFQGLKANEFWVISKITAMTLIKIFQAEMLPKALQTLLRKTLFRRIFQKGLHLDKTGKVQARRRNKYTWHLRRLLCKTERMRLQVIA